MRSAEIPPPFGLMCDLLARPEGIPIFNRCPRFTWVVPGSARQPSQSGYQVQVWSGEALVWDSGRVASEQSVSVEWEGSPLHPGLYRWKVRVWLGSDGPSAWSGEQNFQIKARPAPWDAADFSARCTVSRYPLEVSEIAAIEFRCFGEGGYFADFGRVAFGRPGFNFPVSGGPRNLTLHLGEAVDAEGFVERNPPGSVRYQRFEVEVLSDGSVRPLDFAPQDAREMPTEIGAIMPFRYLEIENGPADLTAGSVRQHAVTYPFDDHAAEFSCSDERLNGIWEFCRYSIKATSFCGLYVDGDRERLPYEADAYVNQLSHYCCDREFTLARYTHEHLLFHPTWPTEWVLCSPLIAWTDYLYSGDDRSVREFYSELKAKTLAALAGEDGLISTVDPEPAQAVLDSVFGKRLRDIVDWPPSEREEFDFRPVNSVVNAYHYAALKALENSARGIGFSEEAAELEARAVQVFKAFNTAFFDGETGLYLDGRGSKHASVHANMFALAFGLVPEERVGRVADFLGRKGMACSVYGAQFLLEALYRAHRADRALELLTAKGPRGWSHMIREMGLTITPEAWTQEVKPNQDWNHAWATAPANIIPRMLMGVTPLEPGFARMRIKPQPAGLSWAGLKLPTVRGVVLVDYANSGHQGSLGVTIPGNTEAEVWLPDGSAPICVAAGHHRFEFSL